MHGRRLAMDERARVPFAMVAVLILMLSVFSITYLSGIRHREAGLSMINAEVSRQNSILHQVEEKMALEGYYVAAMAVAASTQFLCNETMLDACFQENYSAYLGRAFPMFSDPYRVEVRDFRSYVFLEEKDLHDLVPSNATVGQNITLKDDSGATTNDTMEVLDTVTGERFAETSALARYMVVGYGNCTVRNVRSGAAAERPLSFRKAVNSPYPLMNSKMMALESAGGNNAMGLARTVKYTLTTLAQFRVLEGYGSGLDSAPGGTDGIITLKDVQLAINLAVLLESARLFRDYDDGVLSGLESLGMGAGGSTLHSLFGDYMNNGTLDPADIISLYTGLGSREIPADVILAQAFNAIADQFVLKYLDYFGITDIANAVYRTGQRIRTWVEDVGRSLSQFIFGSDGENREGARQVSDWVAKLGNDLSWPPEASGHPDVVLGGGFSGQAYLAVHDVLQPVSESFNYSGDCAQLLSESAEPILDTDGALIGELRSASLLTRNITADTAPSQSSPYPIGYLADFRPASILRQSPEMVSLWSDYYKEFYESQEDVIYETIRDAVKNITMEMSRIITTFVGQTTLTLSDYAGGKFSIDPADRVSVLESVRDMVSEVIDEATEHLRGNPGAANALLATLSSKQSQLVLDLSEFISQNYDIIADKASCLSSATASLSLSMLRNSTVTAEESVTFPATYSVYNALGHSRGFVDDALPYDCTTVPDKEAYVQAILSQNRQDLSSDILPYAESAYERLKAAESRRSHFGSPDNGLYIKALEDYVRGLPASILLRFIGFDPSSFVSLARDMVMRVLDGIIWSGEVSNTQYAPEMAVSDASGRIPFGFYEGSHELALMSGDIWHENLTVAQPDGILSAIPRDWALPVPTLPSGALSVHISEPAGVHYTDAATFNERPFENRWDITINGTFRLSVSGSSLPYIENGTHQPAVVERDIAIGLSIPIVAYSGWDIVGVEYDSTSTLAGDVAKLLDIISAFFEWVWNTIAGPIGWIIDQVMKVIEFFTDIIGTLLGYASEVMSLMADIIGFLVETVQNFIRDVASWALDMIVDWVIGLLPDGLEFRFDMFGFSFLVSFGSDEEIQGAESGSGGTLMSVSTEGNLLGGGFDIGLELISLPDAAAEAVGMEYDLLLRSDIDMQGFKLETSIDPFMAVNAHLVECRGAGSGFGLELLVPEVECYDSVSYSLHDIPGVGAALSNIPIPFLGLKASVNAGLEILYTLRGLEADHPVINEVELNPRGRAAGNQWVELYNPTETEVCLDGWTLAAGNIARTFNASHILGPADYLTLLYDDAALPTHGTAFKLLDPGGAQVDATPSLSEPDNGVADGIPVGPMGGQMTWQRSPNGADLALEGRWMFGDGTMGSENAAVDIDFKTVAWNLLKGAFNATWQDLKGQLALSLDFIVKLVTRFIQHFLDRVLSVIERSVVETSLFIDVMLTEITGTAGGGITLSFVIEGGDTLAAILRWVIGSVSAFLAKFGKPTQPAQYPKLAADIPEHLYIRLEPYCMVQIPKMMRAAVQSAGDMDRVKLAGRIEANIPALAALVGRDMGRWRVNFGVYVDNMPAEIADPLFGTGGATPDVWLFKGAVFET